VRVCLRFRLNLLHFHETRAHEAKHVELRKALADRVRRAPLAADELEYVLVDCEHANKSSSDVRFRRAIERRAL